MIDIHCHLEYTENIIEVIEEGRKRMKAIINSVAEPKEVNKILQLSKKYQSFLFISLGFHPECLKDYSDEEIEDYIDFIKEKKNEICAIGEVGLDYSQAYEKIEKERMKKTFSRFIDLAKEINLPLVIHTREAFDDVLEILKNKKVENVCFHCFSGSEGNLKEALRRGYFISFATNIYYTKKHPRLAKICPLEKMVLETDSPWLDPENPSSLTNRPWKIAFSAEKIAQMKETTKEKILEITTKNALDFFHLSL